MSDPLSDVLDLVGVKSSVYFQKDFRAPWGMLVSDTGFAQFHIIVRGTALVTHDMTQTELSAGDIILFPRGASHLICDQSQSTQMSGKDVITAMAEGNEPFTEGDVTARMICGHFEYDFGCTHPVLEELPSMIVLRASDGPMLSHLFGLVQLIVWETTNEAPGSEVVVRRLSDGLLVAMLRAYYESSAPPFGFYQGLSDPRLIVALKAIHQSTGAMPEVNELAALAGMSRSSFLSKFKETVGQTAGAYATQWRLLKARGALALGVTSIETIAFEAGYSSASAFSRAFQNVFGQTPSEYRKSLTF